MFDWENEIALDTMQGNQASSRRGADSLDQVELIMALEEEFGADIPDEDAEKLQTVGDAIAYVEAKSQE